MHKTVADSVSLAGELTHLLQDASGADVLILPPFTALYAVREVLKGSSIRLGAQNMYFAAEGAFTGEIAPGMLREVGCTYVLIGHSERRQVFGETDNLVNKKLQASFAYGLTPILCVGETLTEREEQRAAEVINGQIRRDLAGLDAAQMAEMVIAYEPIWAIGTGKVASTVDAQEICHRIRETVGNLFGTATAAAVRILYGGSVKPGNIAELMREDDVDGALVGGASLVARDFAAIVRYQ